MLQISFDDKVEHQANEYLSLVSHRNFIVKAKICNSQYLQICNLND